MANMAAKKNPMPEQDPEIRNKNFLEVALGYTPEQAQNEADRCLNCKKPACITGCPVKIDIPGFIMKIKEGDLSGAYDILSKDSSLPAGCGRVCPQESQCEAQCVRGKKHEPVAIGRLERYVADMHMANSSDPFKKPELNGHKAAVIGAGPAGLTCAGDLARMGYSVTIFEALHMPAESWSTESLSSGCRRRSCAARSKG
jgi:glutamate synthase (NADPH/NADH) small chain